MFLYEIIRNLKVNFMKQIDTLVLLTVFCCIQIYLIQACDASEASDKVNSDYSCITSLESYDSDEELFFIEKPDHNGGTKYFKIPTIIKAVRNIENEDELIILAPIDYVIGNKLPSISPLLADDFIACHGPARELQPYQYKHFVENNNYPYASIKKLQENRLSLQDYLETSTRKIGQYKTSHYSLATHK